jgi:parvulin-like peptidyl-prolyl isomerase
MVKKMKHIIELLIFISLFTTTLFGQYEDDKILAEIGPVKITVGEFKKRYEMVPHLSNGKKSEERLKAETLYSIIAEKLWALKAEDLGFDTTDVMRLTFKNIEEMHMRDALYRKEIMSKVNISAKKIAEAKKRASYFLNTKFIHSTDKNEIEELYNQIKAGISFDSLLAVRPEFEIQKNQYYQVHFGKMSEQAEDILYRMKAGEVSRPIQSQEGWYIFKVYSLKREPVQNEHHARTLEKKARSVVEERENQKAYQNFYKSFFPGKKVETDGNLFWSLSDKIINAVLRRRKAEKTPPNDNVKLTAEDFSEIEKSFGADSLNMIFVKFPKDPITLQKFIRSFAFEGFYTGFTNPDKIRAQLNSRVKRFIELEFLARKAEEEGMQNIPEVKEDIAMWRDNYLATLYKKTLFDSSGVTEAEVKNYYLKTKGKTENKTLINIIEIITDNLETAEKIFRELDEGKSFEETAKKYSPNKNITTGLISADTKGEIGRIAKELNIGEVYGPVQQKNKYVIFKLLDKKEVEVKLPKEFNELKNNLTKELKWKKLQKKMIDNTVSMANKYGVTVNEKLLYNLPIKNYNMLVYRYMGFGGRLLAVPLTPTFLEWVEKWQKSKQALP